MSSIKISILFIISLLSQIGLSQTTDAPMPYMQDFKSVSANNTVTVTSYEKGGSITYMQEALEVLISSA